ncbi:MAG: hypothetical protein AAFO63_00285 [Pseudomonadota bacterium]
MTFSLGLSDHEKETLDTLWHEIKAGNIGKLEMYEIQHAVDLVRKQESDDRYHTDLELFVEHFLRQEKVPGGEG